jgi:hypothetical protein
MLNNRPFLNAVRKKYEEINSTLGDGENNYGTVFSIKPTESWESRNLCSDSYPAMTVRKGRSTYIPVSSTNVFHTVGQRNNDDLHYQRTTTWSYWDSSVKQKDTITLSGTSGTANVKVAGGLTKLATFSSTLATTATNFVTANAAAYLAVGITLTAGTGTLIFEAVTAGVYFDHPTITNVTTNLAGTVANTTPNEVTVQAGLTAATGRIEEFNTGTTKYTLLMNGIDRYSWDGSTATSLGNAPLTKIFTVHKGRIYALLGSQLKFSALNILDDWTTANDAGSISITNAKGDGSGIVTFNDYVTVFTNYSMHQLFGTGPDSYELKDIPGNVGCVSDRSIGMCNDVLYWAWYDGIYKFDGSIPQKISYKVDDYFSNINPSYFSSIATGVQGDCIYISIPYGLTQTTNNLVLIYDTLNDKWYVDDSVQYTGFTTMGKTLYGIEATAKTVCKVNDSTQTSDLGTTDIEWYWISGARLKGSVSKNKTLSELWVTYTLSSSSHIHVYVSPTADQSDWVLVQTITGTDSNIARERVKVPISSIAGVEQYRLKITGTGQCTIHYVTEKYRVKG